jgi:hypothetical protein
MPSQPSPSVAARLTAALDPPPTIKGTRGDGAGTHEEAHVITDTHMVDALVGDELQCLPEALRSSREVIGGKKEAETDIRC